MRRWVPRWFWILAVFVCASQGADAAGPTEGPRLALVIGNGAYRAAPLPTAADDAGLVALGLAQAGFDVTAMGDVDAATLRRTVAAFLDQLRDAGAGATVFVYLSGYGVQYGGDNFFVPLGARLDRQADVPAEALALGEISRGIEALPARARVFVYDLARENPFAKADPMPLAPGLTARRAPPGSLYAFNAAPGRTARADIPPYGLYARALVEMLRTPGLTAGRLFARVRLRVAESTGGAVVPWDDANLGDEVAFGGADGGPPVRLEDRPVAGLPLATAYWTAIAQDRLPTYRAFLRAFPESGLAIGVRSLVAARLEAAVWSESLRADSAAAYWTYMLRYPRGPHYVDVRRRLAAIHAPLEPPPRFDPYDFAELPPPDPVQGPDTVDPAVGDSDRARPHVPDDLLPPPVAATDLDLAPPPLVPVGALPIPAPLPAVEAVVARPGRIAQPFVRGLGPLIFEMNEAGTLRLSSEDGPITRISTIASEGGRTIVQTDAADEIVSRTTVTRVDGTLVTLTQTGPAGEVIVKVVTRIDPLGERSTLVTNAENQPVARLRADRRGIVEEISQGVGTLAAPTFVLPPSEDRPLLPPPPPPAAAPAPKPAIAPPRPPPPAMPSPATPPPRGPPGGAPDRVAAPSPFPRPAPPAEAKAAPMPVPRPDSLKKRQAGPR